MDKIKQTMIDFHTFISLGTAAQINELIEQLQHLSKCFSIEDDDNQCCISSAIDNLMQIKLYDGDGNRF